YRTLEIFHLFQAQGGIRDFHVTGVQTCALPISEGGHLLRRQATALVELRECPVRLIAFGRRDEQRLVLGEAHVRRALETVHQPAEQAAVVVMKRSEERRVGKACRYRGLRPDRKKKQLSTLRTTYCN